jgi:group I intron endonuclease
MRSEYKVYKHTAPNGKIYIGITSQQDINRRWQSGYGYKGNEHFYRAIKKYGWSNINHEILFDGLSKEEAERKEIELISKYKATDPNIGYNIENGGNCSGTHSEETKQKISRAQIGEKNHMYGKHSWSYGKKMSAEFCEKNRIAHLGIPASNKGKPMSEEQKAKLRRPKTEEHKRKLSEAKSIAVICLETGERFESGKAAGDAKGISRGSIAYVVKGKRKTAGGLHWTYA